MIFLNRSRRGPDPHLDWKVRLFLAGAAIAVLGMALESTPLIALAGAVLLAGVVLRWVPPRGAEGAESGEARGSGPGSADRGDPREGPERGGRRPDPEAGGGRGREEEGEGREEEGAE